jgi:hypothetical protein
MAAGPPKEDGMRKALWPATVVASAILAASACMGQTNRGDLIANIPFRFVVARQTLPPGCYIVTHMGETNIRIYNSRNQGALVPTHAVGGKAPEGAGRIVFRRYRETFVLSQIWFAANATGRQVFPSRVEQELARKEAPSEVAVLRIAQ